MISEGGRARHLAIQGHSPSSSFIISSSSAYWLSKSSMPVSLCTCTAASCSCLALLNTLGRARHFRHVRRVGVSREPVGTVSTDLFSCLELQQTVSASLPLERRNGEDRWVRLYISNHPRVCRGSGATLTEVGRGSSPLLNRSVAGCAAGDIDGVRQWLRGVSRHADTCSISRVGTLPLVRGDTSMSICHVTDSLCHSTNQGMAIQW